MKDMKTRLKELTRSADEELKKLLMEDPENVSYAVIASADGKSVSIGCGGRVENIMRLLARAAASLMDKADADPQQADAVFDQIKMWSVIGHQALTDKRTKTGGKIN